MFQRIILNKNWQQFTQLVLDYPPQKILYTVSSYFTIDFIGVIPTAYYMNPIQGFNFALTDAMRFVFSYTSSNPIRYAYSIWFGTYFPITHLQVWIAYNFTQYLSLTCSHTRISQLLDFSVSSLTQTVKILETQIELSNIEFIQ